MNSLSLCVCVCVICLCTLKKYFSEFYVFFAILKISEGSYPFIHLLICIYINGVYIYIIYIIYIIHIILYIEFVNLFSDCSCIPLHAPSLSNSTFLRPWPYISFASSVFSLAHYPLPGACLHPASFCWLHLVLINNPRWNWAISPCYATTYIIHHYQLYPSSTLAPSV